MFHWIHRSRNYSVLHVGSSRIDREFFFNPNRVENLTKGIACSQCRSPSLLFSDPRLRELITFRSQSVHYLTTLNIVHSSPNKPFTKHWFLGEVGLFVNNIIPSSIYGRAGFVWHDWHKPQYGRDVTWHGVTYGDRDGIIARHSDWINRNFVRSDRFNKCRQCRTATVLFHRPNFVWV